MDCERGRRSGPIAAQMASLFLNASTANNNQRGAAPKDARAETGLTGSCMEKQASVSAVTCSGSAAIKAAQSPI